MQSVIFKLPDLGEGVVEAEIVAWHVKPGEDVCVDQPLVDVMTDKATVTIPSGIVGRVVRTHGNVGQTVAVGAQLVSFDTLVAEQAPQTPLHDGAACLPLSMAANSMPPLVQQAVSPTENSRNGHPQASPAVRRRARELHVDLHHVHGSGPNGRITHGDIDVHLRSEVSPTPTSH